MHKKCDKTECFRNISGCLGVLPSEYKKWKGSLQAYRDEYSFMKDSDLKESVAMLKMNFDYQLSLYEWLKPFLVFEEHHKYILYQILASIYEALFLDYLKMKSSKIADPSMLKIIQGTLDAKNKGLGSYIDIIFNAKDSLINKDWKDYLGAICELRNTVHPSKLKSSSLPDNKALKWGLDNAQTNLLNFTKNLRKKY
jgi:hypothetical protein